MEVVNLFLPATNQFATDYYQGKLNIEPFFHYHYQKLSHYEKRIEELAHRSFMRNELADHISEYMRPFPNSNRVNESIEKLRQENSVVVIGGQQAGIFTGPLYTIHKVISIIAFAKEKEEELGIPVVPVFWIAGEDHDFLEVNHVYLPAEMQLEKCIYPEKMIEKRMVSDCSLNKETCLNWARDVIETLGETKYTKSLLQLVEKAINHSETLVDFFAQIIMELFKDHGLLLVDSGSKQLRKMEKEIFLKQIQETERITEAVKIQQALIREHGLNNAIDISHNAANLFFYDEKNHERILLEFDNSTQTFLGKNNTVKFSMEELLEIAREFPEKLSNNVVTRPVTQELLFPTLAFIAGPGEISYWAELKKVFEEFDMNMPPIVPRINITLLERNIEADIDELELELEEVLRAGIKKQKDRFLNIVKDKEMEALFAEMRNQLQHSYSLIEQKVMEEYRGLLPVIKKNETLLLNQVDFLEGKIEEAIKLKHDVQLRKYSNIEKSLRPQGGLQERMWNIFYFLNKYGVNFVDELASLPYQFDGNHKVVKI